MSWTDETEAETPLRLETGRIRILYGQYKGLARTQARSTLTLPKTDLGRPLKLETNLCLDERNSKQNREKLATNSGID